jgi:hypothetical protein
MECSDYCSPFFFARPGLFIHLLDVIDYEFNSLLSLPFGFINMCSVPKNE